MNLQKPMDTRDTKPTKVYKFRFAVGGLKGDAPSVPFHKRGAAAAVLAIDSGWLDEKDKLDRSPLCQGNS